MKSFQDEIKERNREILKWAEEECPHEWVDFYTQKTLPPRNKGSCPKCRAELKREIK